MIMHLLIYVPVILIAGAVAYHFRYQLKAAKARVTARLKALR